MTAPMVTSERPPYSRWVVIARPVAERLSIPVEDVTSDALWDFGCGCAVEGARCDWPLWPNDYRKGGE